MDWASTRVGDIKDWPEVLKTTLALMLCSSFPKALVWGKDLLTFHNDAFRVILGDKPLAIGRPFSEVWSEAWETIEPIAVKAMNGQSTFIENFPLTINRNGSSEQAYFTFSYSPVISAEGEILGMMDTVVETTLAVQAQQRAEILNRELTHRMRNMLTLVGSIASQTLRSGGTPQELETAFSQRLQALASVQDMLKTGHATEADVHSIIASAVAPHAIAEGRINTEGPNLHLLEPQALALSLALNELITNAIKYGSLSNDTGTISIRWNKEIPGDNGFYLHWQETGGPLVTQPIKAGFGSRLIQRHVASAFGGSAQVTYEAGGLRYEIKPAEG
ncbi:sensor histidine kinase [Aureimonas fodinaquatilis]|nr:PAS domain-containing sensor histidine kinase [Aureimonas fodinaquatilis]